jgi:hypothetical protein
MSRKLKALLHVVARGENVFADIPVQFSGIIAAPEQLFGIGLGNFKEAGVAAEYLTESLGLNEGFK